MKLRIFLFWAVLCFAESGYGAAWATRQETCSDSIRAAVGQHLQLRDFSFSSEEASGTIRASACKIWPAFPGKIIAAFVHESGNGENELTDVTAVLDRRTMKVLSAHAFFYEEDATSAVRDSSLVIDTARYRLNGSTMAFGVRLRTFHDRCGYEGGADDELTMYVQEGREIRPVFTQDMERWRYAEGNRCSGEGVRRWSAETSMAVLPTSTHGFHDLKFTARRDDQARPLSMTVKYDGRSYDLRHWRQSFNSWMDD